MGGMTAVLFDMDGTLVDSLSDIAGSLNHVLLEAGLPTHPLAAYRRLVGDGASELVRRAIPSGRGDLHEALLARYKARYRSHLIVETRPFAGVEAVLEALEARGVPKAVVTNKPHEPAVEIVERLLGRFAWSASRRAPQAGSGHGALGRGPHRDRAGALLLRR
jgi:phosphoglycolate phosphatase